MDRWKIWIEQLAERIVWSVSKSGADPLDADETERIGRLLALELDLKQGNLTDGEYEQELLLLERG